MGIGGGGECAISRYSLPHRYGYVVFNRVCRGRFLYPTGIAAFTRCGLAADLSFFINFYGLALFAAGGLNNGGINDSGGCFLCFEAFFGQLVVNQFQQFGQGVVLRQPVAVAA